MSPSCIPQLHRMCKSPFSTLRCLGFYQLLLPGDVFAEVSLSLCLLSHWSSEPAFLPPQSMHLFLSSHIYYFWAHSLISMLPCSSSSLRKTAGERNFEKFAYLIIYGTLIPNWFFCLNMELEVCSALSNPFRMIKRILTLSLPSYAVVVQFDAILMLGLLIAFFFSSRGLKDLLFRLQSSEIPWLWSVDLLV